MMIARAPVCGMRNAICSTSYDTVSSPGSVKTVPATGVINPQRNQGLQRAREAGIKQRSVSPCHLHPQIPVSVPKFLYLAMRHAPILTFVPLLWPVTVTSRYELRDPPNHRERMKWGQARPPK